MMKGTIPARMKNSQSRAAFPRKVEESSLIVRVASSSFIQRGGGIGNAMMSPAVCGIICQASMRCGVWGVGC